ncbi:MAG: hypothetical protein QME52_03435 [Bacteroidota bacterium]|nr:hypothetical protein [Bacteroidota bacterium]
MKEIDFVISHQAEFLKFLKSKFPVIHNSNLFFRDIHYGIMWYLQEHKLDGRYQIAEKVVQEVIKTFVQNGILKKINEQTWVLDYPEFALPRIEKKTTA